MLAGSGGFEYRYMQNKNTITVSSYFILVPSFSLFFAHSSPQNTTRNIMPVSSQTMRVHLLGRLWNQFLLVRSSTKNPAEGRKYSSNLPPVTAPKLTRGWHCCLPTPRDDVRQRPRHYNYISSFGLGVPRGRLLTDQYSSETEVVHEETG